MDCVRVGGSAGTRQWTRGLRPTACGIAGRHHRKQRAPIVADALANRSGQQVVGPRTHPCTEVGSEIGRHHVAWQLLVPDQVLAGSLPSRRHRSIVATPIVWGMAVQAAGHGGDQIAPPRQPLRRARERQIRGRTRVRSEERAPSDGDTDGRDEQEPTAPATSILRVWVLIICSSAACYT